MSLSQYLHILCVFFFFNDTATTEIYTLSLHDALPIWAIIRVGEPLGNFYGYVWDGIFQDSASAARSGQDGARVGGDRLRDRKSTRLNSSHSQISYAVFCLKKKKKRHKHLDRSRLANRC